jgi:hypothetical protein
VSDDTKTALEAALTAHIADECDGRIVTDWAMVVANTGIDAIGTGETYYYLEANSNQPPHVSEGLLSRALRLLNEDNE